MRRLFGILFGLTAQVVLLLTVPPLYRFLHNDFASARPGPLWIDTLAALQFVVPHSILLHPATRKRVTRWLRSEFYGSLFCLATCAGLWIQFALWRGSNTVIWAWPQSLQPVIQAGFFASWIALFYSMSLTGIGYQSGLTPWLYWLRGRTVPQRQFNAKSIYRYVRHPVYLSFLGLVWLTPVVTADRAVLIAVWTVYVLIGSHLKDLRMTGLVGEPYLHYRRTVRAFPFAAWKPVAAPQGNATAAPTVAVPAFSSRGPDDVMNKVA